jgi:hypothetical protein
MGLIFSKAYDPAQDPYATTVDDISAYYHVQSVTKGGTFLDLVVTSAANYPDALAGTPSRYFGYFPMRIDRSDLSGSRPIVVKDETTATTLTRVTGSPSTNEYRIPPENSIRRNTVEFHSGQAGHTISYDYYGEATMFSADEWNRKRWINYYSVTDNYTILDGDLFDEIHVAHSASTGLITIGLPTVAANEGRRIRVQNTGLGLTKVDGEGAETISYKGNALSVFYLVGEDDYIDIISNGTEWKVLHCYMCIESGFYNRSDWTAGHIGFANFDYDNQSDSSDRTGFKYVLDSGVTGLCIEDSAPSGNSGTYTVCFVTGTGLAINDEEVTFGDSITADVNEGSGNNKNQDWDITHNMGINIKDYTTRMFFNSTASWTAANEQILFFIERSDTNKGGYQLNQVDSDNVVIWSGLNYQWQGTNAGGVTLYQTSDIYANVTIEISA